jgi:hypothetical protein
MKTFKNYLLDSLLNPKEADAYFEALCSPDVTTSDFLRGVQVFSAFSVDGFPCRAFATLLHEKTNAWYWVLLSDRIGRSGFYRQNQKDIVVDLAFTFDCGDYRLPKEERLIEIPDTSFLPVELKPRFEAILSKRFFAKYPFNV